MAPALALKGLGSAPVPGPRRHLPALAMITGAVLLALLPPVAGIPLGAYVAIGLLLVGGIAALPLGIGILLDRLAPVLTRRAIPMLALERARRQRETAAVATSGVVAIRMPEISRNSGSQMLEPMARPPGPAATPARPSLHQQSRRRPATAG